MALDERLIVFVDLVRFNPDFIVRESEAEDDEEEHAQTHVRHVQKEVTVIAMADAIIQPSWKM
jgi:hypothetical protein